MGHRKQNLTNATRQAVTENNDALGRFSRQLMLSPFTSSLRLGPLGTASGLARTVLGTP